MANNKVIDKDGNVLLDLTEDDVVEADVISGKKFHTRDGVQRTGSAVLATKTITENGTYAASADSASGYSSVTVNVSGDADPIKDAIDALTALPAKSWVNLFYVYNSFKSLFYKMTSVKSSWFENSAQIVNMTRMFSSCSSLTAVPLFDTSNVTDMSEMFDNCSSLTTVPLFNTSNVTNMQSMFNYCSSLTAVPLFDTSNVTDMSYMFYNCTNLTTVPVFNMSKVTTIGYMFYHCSSLTTVPLFDVSNVTSIGGTFDGCSNLEEIHMTGMKASFGISSSTKFTREALVEILGNLATVSSTKTLTMGATNLAKLTEEDKAIATNKGWTLA